MILKFHFNGRCDHEQIKNAEGCIVEIIGENNPDHFYVGTQDTDMRKKFQEVRVFFFHFKLFYMIFGC
jgi:rRNA-processing protein FCF1